MSTFGVGFQKVIASAIPTGAEIRSAFDDGLQRISAMPLLPPGLAVLLFANMGMLGRSIGAGIFSRIDWEKAKGEEAQVLGGLARRIEKGSYNPEPIQRKRVGRFVVQFNEIRGFRPVREAKRDGVKLDEAFDPEKFNYKKTHPDEKFMSVEVDGIKFDFLYNKFPFAPYHFVLVPDLEAGLNQFLNTDSESSRRVMEAAWKIARGIGDPNIRLCFNAQGAHASVNHLHFQGFFVSDNWILPIDTEINKKGKLDGWALDHASWVQTRDNLVDSIFGKMGALCERDSTARRRGKNSKDRLSFNFYMRPDGIAFFPRRHQGNRLYVYLLNRRPSFSTGFAFYEMLGEVICPSRGAFEEFRSGTLGAADIQAIYDSLSLSAPV